MAVFRSNRPFPRRRSSASIMHADPARALSRVLLSGLIAAATGIGLWSLRYLLPSQPHAVHFENFVNQHTAFTLHAAFASIALLVGPWQFLPSLLLRKCSIHRLLGRIYICAVTLGWLASLPLALHAHSGAAASAGFQVLGICWVTCTLLGLINVRAGRLFEHRRWMIRSYALTTAAITLRLYIAGSDILHIPLDRSYPYIAWLCWIPNALAAELIIRVTTAPRCFFSVSDGGLASSAATFPEPRVGQPPGKDSTPAAP
jgi:uncharacterized membrane protein